MIAHQPPLTVRHSGIVRLPRFDDTPDGTICIAEGGKSVPFAITRVYFITNLGNTRAVRGRHAHKTLEQYIFCISGQFTLHLDDGDQKNALVLDKPDCGVRLGPMLWHTMTDFSAGCVILVLADGFYDPDDYIRDYDEFLECARRD